MRNRFDWSAQDPNIGEYEIVPNMDPRYLIKNKIKPRKDKTVVEKDTPNNDSINPFSNRQLENATMENLLANSDQNRFILQQNVPIPIGVLPMYNSVLMAPTRDRSKDKKRPNLESRLKNLQDEKLRADLLASGAPLPPPGTTLVTPLRPGSAVVESDSTVAVAVPKDSAQGTTVKKLDGTIVTTSKPGDVLVSTVPAVPGKNVLLPGTLIVPAGTNAERYARSPSANV